MYINIGTYGKLLWYLCTIVANEYLTLYKKQCVSDTSTDIARVVTLQVNIAERLARTVHFEPGGAPCFHINAIQQIVFISTKI